MTGCHTAINSEAFFKRMAESCLIYKTDTAAVLIEPYGLAGNFRGWLVFRKFDKAVVTLMRKALEDFSGDTLYASTADARVKRILEKLGFVLFSYGDGIWYINYRRVYV